MLEAAQHQDNTFLTLTYEDSKLPRLTSPDALPTLNPKHLQDWLKRLRWETAPLKLRFYAVGEYGDESWRPHYHVALFNFATCARGRTRRDFRNRPLALKCCPSCSLVQRTWGYGDVDLGTVATESAQYLAGYTTKKMTDPKDDRLHGRHPEFARMSNRPGVGADAMDEIAHVFLSLGLENTQADVPSALRHGKRLFPLGRYLRRRLRARIGREVNAPSEVVNEIWEKEMRPLLEKAKASKTDVSLSSQMALENFGYHESMSLKERTGKKGRKL